VEAFLVRLPAGIRQGDGILVSDGDGRYAVIELAARMKNRVTERSGRFHLNAETMLSVKCQPQRIAFFEVRWTTWAVFVT